MKTINIAILGLGVVGSHVVKLLEKNSFKLNNTKYKIVAISALKYSDMKFCNIKMDEISDEISNIFGKEISVNSYHKNIIYQNNLGKNLKAFAITKKDNSIEGFFHNQYSILGVMWHPERKQNKNNKILLQKIFANDNEK